MFGQRYRNYYLIRGGVPTRESFYVRIMACEVVTVGVSWSILRGEKQGNFINTLIL